MGMFAETKCRLKFIVCRPRKINFRFPYMQYIETSTYISIYIYIYISLYIYFLYNVFQLPNRTPPPPLSVRASRARWVGVRIHVILLGMAGKKIYIYIHLYIYLYISLYLYIYIYKYMLPFQTENERPGDFP